MHEISIKTLSEKSEILGPKLTILEKKCKKEYLLYPVLLYNHKRKQCGL